MNLPKVLNEAPFFSPHEGVWFSSFLEKDLSPEIEKLPNPWVGLFSCG